MPRDLAETTRAVVIFAGTAVRAGGSQRLLMGQTLLIGSKDVTTSLARVEIA